MSVRLSTSSRAPAPGSCSRGAENVSGRSVAGRVAAAGVPEPSSPRCLRQSEVQHLHPALRRDFHVGGLQVAVDDSFLVCRFEASAIWRA